MTGKLTGESFDDRLRRLRILLFDVDGILTDGGLYVSESGDVGKRFHIHDGAGLKFAQQAGLSVGLISGHASAATKIRANGLGLEFCHTGVKDKVAVFEDILRQKSAEPAEALFMGDDIMDLPVLRRAGAAVTVPEAHATVRARCDHVTEKGGGRGAVREIIERILDVQGKLDAIIASYSR